MLDIPALHVAWQQSPAQTGQYVDTNPQSVHVSSMINQDFFLELNSWIYWLLPCFQPVFILVRKYRVVRVKRGEERGRSSLQTVILFEEIRGDVDHTDPRPTNTTNNWQSLRIVYLR